MALYGVEGPVMKNGLIGALVGAFFIATKKLTNLSLALPTIPMAGMLATTAGQWIVIVGLAPVAEELFFRCLLLSLLVTFVGWKFWQANLVQATAFSFYHIIAYAGEIAASAIMNTATAFIAAFVFGLVAGWLVKKFGLTTPIVAHALLNAALLSTGFILIA